MQPPPQKLSLRIIPPQSRLTPCQLPRLRGSLLVRFTNSYIKPPLTGRWMRVQRADGGVATGLCLVSSTPQSPCGDSSPASGGAFWFMLFTVPPPSARLTLILTTPKAPVGGLLLKFARGEGFPRFFIVFCGSSARSRRQERRSWQAHTSGLWRGSQAQSPQTLWAAPCSPARMHPRRA